MTETKTRRAKIPAPKTYEECDGAIDRLGAAERALDIIQAEMVAKLVMVKAEYEAKAAPWKDAKKDLSKGVQKWCEKHRDELLKPGAKTHRFPAGEVTWRVKPPRVVIANEKKGGAESVIALARKLKLSKFLRVRTEIDKEAMLADKSRAVTIPGVSIAMNEEQFEIAPFDTPLGESAP